MTDNPRVSVVMTAYKGSKLIAETIESILTQSFRDFELIIIEDCSPDDTAEVIKKFSDPRIKLHQNPENLGISRSRNRGMSLARGEYIAATDQDDISLPDRLARQVAFLDQNPDFVLTATAAKELRSGKLRSYYFPEMRPHVLHWALFTRSRIVHSSICFRRRTQQEFALEYDDRYRFAEDYLLFHRFAEAGKIVILPEELMIYRQHPENNSTIHADEMNHNGASFMTTRYQEYLGLDFDLIQVKKLWQVFNTGTAVNSKTDLEQVGRWFAQALEAFIKRKNASALEAQELRDWSSQRWWGVVSSQVKETRNTDLFDSYRAIPELSGFQPSYLNRLKVRAATHLPLPMVTFLRRLLN